jgi:hypothetical protein
MRPRTLSGAQLQIEQVRQETRVLERAVDSITRGLEVLSVPGRIKESNCGSR